MLVNYKLISLIVLLILIQIASISSPILNVLLPVLFAIWIIICIIRGRRYDAMWYLGLFGITSFEKASFIFEEEGTSFSILDMPYLGSYFFVFIVVYMFVYYCFKYKPKGKYLFSDSIFSIEFLAIFTLVMGIVQIVVISFVKSVFLSAINYDLIHSGITSIFLLCMSMMFKNNILFKKKYELLLVNSLFAYVIVGCLTSLFGIHGFYGNMNEEILLLPLPSFFVLCLIMFIKEKQINSRFFLIVCSILAIYLQFATNNALGGKSWILFCCVVISLIYSFSVRKSFPLVLFFSLVLGLTVFFLIPNSSIIRTDNVKAQEALSLLNMTSIQNYSDVEGSPQFRITEFLNIIEDYIQNPELILFGQGYGGYISDHLSAFGLFNASAFSDAQYLLGKFYSLHESLNVIFLKFGLVGLILLIILLVKYFKNTKDSPWNLVGFLWLIFYWDYSYSLLLFGGSAILFGDYKDSMSFKTDYKNLK